MSDVGQESQKNGYEYASMFALYKIYSKAFAYYLKKGNLEVANSWGVKAYRINDKFNKNSLAQSP